jgi:hypothetical protein
MYATKLGFRSNRTAQAGEGVDWRGVEEQLGGKCSHQKTRASADTIHSGMHYRGGA